MAGKLRKVRKTIIIEIGLALCLSVMLCIPALAVPDPQFRLDMDNLRLQVGVSGYIVVSMENAQGVEDVRFEGLENFDVLSQNASTSYSSSGGETTYQETRYYTVMPKAAGDFTLKAIIQFDGQTYETNTLEVTVSEDPSNGGEAVQDVFVKTVLSHSEAYLGEKIILTYELYSRFSIESLGFTDYTSIDGVVAKEVPDNQLKSEQVYLDSVLYIKYVVKQWVLDPVKSGTYTIPSYNLQADVITNNSSRMGPGGFFGGSFSFSEPRYLQTEEKELTVNPLPSEGKPKDFSGIVGQLQLEGAYSQEQVNYGDSLSLRATAYGSCNLDGLKSVFSGGLPGFAVYETQKSAEETVENGQYRVQKGFEAILVPEKNGAIDVAAISISYFNPLTNAYERAEIPGATIEVLGDMPQQEIGGSQAAATEMVKIDQVNYADANDGTFTIKVEKQVFYGILIGLGVFLVLAVPIMWFLLQRKKEDPALKTLYKQLLEAKDVGEVYNLFGAMIKHRYDLSLKASPKYAIQDSLPDADLAERVTGVMDFVESTKAREEKGIIDLKERIKGIYRMIAS